ncbi:MAG: hypothetical protein UV73_C0008G0047 [Candidatus Gottesmanbacteria bacterium GW2011_GWA2_43_14]|uniref:SpoVT-AbrB domain-containing protein n=1 Tax=Candidatus Gottesmanbacteria bacterium GW2011_GWA2_43_14 TaxID=1618443 RepID=A0A0G1DIV4_9BACT|nr:MAG: hypothetical protein UV73_C0008G0047 [Candidatus Gottesmanbacteria bacterium GW2011_GWA2_43_14]
MIQKIIRVGNSAALTLPKEFLEEAGLKIGDEMMVETNHRAKAVYAKPSADSSKMNLTPEFYNWLDRIGQKYEKTIKKLARL